MNERDQFLLAAKYVTGFEERIVSEIELALIYEVLPYIIPQLIGADLESE